MDKQQKILYKMKKEENKKQLTVCIMKILSRHGQIKYHIKITGPLRGGFNSAYADLKQEAFDLNNKSYDREREALKKEFQEVLHGTFEHFKLETKIDELDFVMKFGDEYIAKSSITCHENSNGKNGNKFFYNPRNSSLNLPLTHEEILFFFEQVRYWPIGIG